MSHSHREMHAYGEREHGGSYVFIIIQFLQLFADGRVILRSMTEELLRNFANQF